MRHPSVLLVLLITAEISLAADPSRETDAALRARIQDFYQLQLKHEFRLAESLVARESKDVYYNSPKTEIQGFKLQSIRYSADNRSADVVVLTRTMMAVLGAPPTPLDFPLHSKWKLEDGIWCWYVDSSTLDTPFGKMKIGNSAGGNDLAQLSRQVMANVQNGVQADKKTIQIDPDHPQRVVINLRNNLPGPVSLVLSAPAGLMMELPKADLGAGESTQLSITPVPGSSSRPNRVVLIVSPTNQQIQIDLSWNASTKKLE